MARSYYMTYVDLDLGRTPKRAKPKKNDGFHDLARKTVALRVALDLWQRIIIRSIGQYRAKNGRYHVWIVIANGQFASAENASASVRRALKRYAPAAIHSVPADLMTVAAATNFDPPVDLTNAEHR